MSTSSTSTIPSIHFDDSMASMNQTFYPSGKVFAMFPGYAQAQAAATELTALEGIASVQHATPEALIAQWAERAEEIRENPPSVGREEQFQVRFVDLARRGQHGLLIEPTRELDAEQAQQILRSAGCSVAYRYGSLVIEEWVAPSRQAGKAGADAL